MTCIGDTGYGFDVDHHHEDVIRAFRQVSHRSTLDLDSSLKKRVLHSLSARSSLGEKV